MSEAYERLVRIWAVPHATPADVEAARIELQVAVRQLPADELPAVIAWAAGRLAEFKHQYWLIFALAYMERDIRALACQDCPSEVRGYPGSRWRYRVIHAGTCPWWKAYQEGRVPRRVPCGCCAVAPHVWGMPSGVVVSHRGPYRRAA